MIDEKTIVPNRDDHETARRELVKLRTKHGAESPIGHACSNLIQLLDAHGREADRGARRRQEDAIARQGVALAVLLGAQ